MEKITKEEFLKRCVDADASTNVNALTKKIVRSEIYIFDYYITNIKNNEIFSVVDFDNEDLIIVSNKEIARFPSSTINKRSA